MIGSKDCCKSNTSVNKIRIMMKITALIFFKNKSQELRTYYGNKIKIIKKNNLIHLKIPLISVQSD